MGEEMGNSHWTNKNFLRTAIGKDTPPYIKPLYSNEIGTGKTVYGYHVHLAEFGEEL